MAKLVTVFGGSGFVGRYIVRRLAKAGYRVRVAVRRPNEALFLKPYGTVGQVEPMLCNVRNDDSVRAALRGADGVINCVGTFDKGGANNFEEVQAVAPRRIARLARENGVARLVHISSLSANADSDSLYDQSKSQGEEAVTTEFPGAVILRPSVIFGPEDGFFNKFGSMARLGPILPIFGGETKFQPVYVDDVAEAAVAAVSGKGSAGIYELGGPEVLTLRALIDRMLSHINRRRLVLNLPLGLGRLMGLGFDIASAATLGLFPNRILTRDQARQLSHDNVVSGTRPGLTDLGVTPTHMDSVLPQYLWRFSPSGQYDSIKQSARNLRT